AQVMIFLRHQRLQESQTPLALPFAAASHETPEIPDEQDQPEDRSHRDERRHAEAAKRGDPAHRTLHALVAAVAAPLRFPVLVVEHGAPEVVGEPGVHIGHTWGVAVTGLRAPAAVAGEVGQVIILGMHVSWVHGGSFLVVYLELYLT